MGAVTSAYEKVLKESKCWLKRIFKCFYVVCVCSHIVVVVIITIIRRLFSLHFSFK